LSKNLVSLPYNPPCEGFLSVSAFGIVIEDHMPGRSSAQYWLWYLIVFFLIDTNIAFLLNCAGIDAKNGCNCVCHLLRLVGIEETSCIRFVCFGSWPENVDFEVGIVLEVTGVLCKAVLDCRLSLAMQNR